MPKGNPKPSTVASMKYQEKAGYVAKTYKLKWGIVEHFAYACAKTGRSQASVITELMEGYVKRIGLEESLAIE